MTVLTKQDLQDWNSHPVTKKIFQEIDKAVEDLKEQSVIRDTCDQTAMQASCVEGVIQGVNSLKDTYYEVEEATE